MKERGYAAKQTVNPAQSPIHDSHDRVIPVWLESAQLPLLSPKIYRRSAKIPNNSLRHDLRVQHCSARSPGANTRALKDRLPAYLVQSRSSLLVAAPVPAQPQSAPGG